MRRWRVGISETQLHDDDSLRRRGDGLLIVRAAEVSVSDDKNCLPNFEDRVHCRSPSTLHYGHAPATSGLCSRSIECLGFFPPIAMPV